MLRLVLIWGPEWVGGDVHRSSQPCPRTCSALLKWWWRSRHRPARSFRRRNEGGTGLKHPSDLLAGQSVSQCAERPLSIAAQPSAPFSASVPAPVLPARCQSLVRAGMRGPLNRHDFFRFQAGEQLAEFRQRVVEVRPLLTPQDWIPRGHGHLRPDDPDLGASS
jgi:hypothetical protein